MQFFLPTHIDCHTVWSVANITEHSLSVSKLMHLRSAKMAHAYKKYIYEIIKIDQNQLTPLVISRYVLPIYDHIVNSALIMEKFRNNKRVMYECLNDYLKS